MTEPAIVQHVCRACGYRYINPAHGDCCSARCVAYLAEGNPSKADQDRANDLFADRTRFGTYGMFTRCRACGVKFESRGLCRCADCTRWNRSFTKPTGSRSVTITADMACPTGEPETPENPSIEINALEGRKRDRLPPLKPTLCVVCRTPVERPRKGKPKRFCSDACRQRAHRHPSLQAAE